MPFTEFILQQEHDIEAEHAREDILGTARALNLGLSAKRLGELFDVFCEADEDGDMLLNAKQLGYLCLRLGFKEDRILDLVDMYSADSKESVAADFARFCQVYKTLLPTPSAAAAAAMKARLALGAKSLQTTASAKSLQMTPSAKSLQMTPSAKSLQMTPSAKSLQMTPSAKSPTAISPSGSMRKTPTAKALHSPSSVKSLQTPKAPQSPRPFAALDEI